MIEHDAYFVKMISELEDLEMRGIFNIRELNEVLLQRNIFETNIRKIKSKVYYLKYVEYETKMGLIREYRAKSRAIIDHSSKSLADYCIYRRIDSILYRATHNFGFEIRFMLLWLWYHKNLKQKKKRDFIRIITRVIHSQPKSRILWLYATTWGLLQRNKKNPNHFRKFIQNCQKENPKNRFFWINYFRFELCSTVKFLNSYKMSHETKDKFVARLDNQNIHTVLDGTAAMHVFYSAINALPFDDKFCLRCTQIVTTIDAISKKSRIEEKIYASITKSFSNIQTWNFRSRRCLLGPFLSITSKHIGRVAREYLLALLNVKNNKTHETSTTS